MNQSKEEKKKTLVLDAFDALFNRRGYIAFPEDHRLATQDRVRLSDLKGEFLSVGTLNKCPA